MNKAPYLPVGKIKLTSIFFPLIVFNMTITEIEPQQRLLNAALSVFANKGYAAASVLEISTKAQVTKPTLYYYFKNKAALYQALVDLAFDSRYNLLIQATADESIHWKVRLTHFIEAMFQFSKTHENLLRLTLSAILGPKIDSPQPIKFSEKAVRNMSLLEDIISQGIQQGDLRRDLSASQLAIPLYRQIFMASLGSLVENECPHPLSSPQEIIDLFLNGAGSRRSKL